MGKNHMLSTSDNPFNPWTQFDDWYAWDTRENYNTLSLLARVVRTADDLPQALEEQAIEDAIIEIVEENVSGVYIMVESPDD